MDNLDQLWLTPVIAAGGWAGWKGLMLILSRLGLGLAQNKTEQDTLTRLSLELDKANARADAANARALISDDRAAKAAQDLADALRKLDLLAYQVGELKETNGRLEQELKQLRETVNHGKAI